MDILQVFYHKYNLYNTDCIRDSVLKRASFLSSCPFTLLPDAKVPPAQNNKKPSHYCA